MEHAEKENQEESFYNVRLETETRLTLASDNRSTITLLFPRGTHRRLAAAGQLRNDPLAQRKQRHRIQDLQRRDIRPQMGLDPIPQLDRGERVHAVHGKRLLRLHGLRQPQALGELPVDELHGLGQQGLAIDFGADHDEESLHGLAVGAVLACVVERVGGVAREAEAAEARVGEELRVRRQGHGYARDRLGDAGGVDAVCLLDDGEGEDAL